MPDNEIGTRKVQISLARGIFTNRRFDGNKRKPVLELLAKNNTAVYQISKIKYDPSFAPELGNIYARKVSAACSFCLPETVLQLDEDVKSLGIHNCFNYETGNLTRPFFSRSFPVFSHFWTNGKFSAEQGSNVSPQEIIDDQDLLTTVIPKDSQSQGEIDRWNVIINDVSKDICCTKVWASVLLTRLAGWLLGKLFSNMFESICVHEGEIELLQRAHATDLPIIYIPINRSYMDSLIIHWTLLRFGLKTPYFFTSENLRYLTKYFGGIGPSQYRNSQDHKRIYGSILTAYVRMLLIKSSSFQLSLEANKSKSGKPSTELYGTELLQILFRAFKSKEIEDVYIVPVNVSYEILPDEFDEARSVDQKYKRPSIVLLIRNIWRSMCKRLGYVRVDFGQPFSFREFYPSMKQNKKIKTIIESYKNKNDTTIESYSKTFEATDLSWNADYGSTASIASLYENATWVPMEEFDSIFLDILSNHSIYSASSSSTPMCTHLVSFILLKRFRYGTTIENLAIEVAELMKILDKRGRDVGFIGDVRSAVARAIELFGPHTIEIFLKKDKSSHSDTEMFLVKPVLNLMSLRRLGYYSNLVFPSFAMESVIAVAMFALVGNQLAVARGFEIDIRAKDEDVITHTRRIYEIIDGAFFLHAPCLTAEIAIRKTLDIMHDASVLQFVMDDSLKRSRKCYDSDEEFEYDDMGANKGSDMAGGEFFYIPYEYKVVSSNENYEKLSFLRNLLVPYLEIYAVIGKELECLISLDGKVIELEEGILRQKILATLKSRFPESEYGELLSKDIVKTALFTFEQKHIIHCNIDKTTKVRRICLSLEYDSTKKVHEFVNNILRYVTY